MSKYSYFLKSDNSSGVKPCQREAEMKKTPCTFIADLPRGRNVVIWMAVWIFQVVALTAHMTMILAHKIVWKFVDGIDQLILDPLALNFSSFFFEKLLQLTYIFLPVGRSTMKVQGVFSFPPLFDGAYLLEELSDFKKNGYFDIYMQNQVVSFVCRWKHYFYWIMNFDWKMN